MDQNAIEKINQEGISLFKSFQYDKALEKFNQLVKNLSNMSFETIKKIRRENYNLRETSILGNVVHPKLASIIDHRAATYEKLQKYGNALQDGMQLMKLDPLCCKGYLRTGKLFMILGEKEKALKVFKNGIRIIENAILKHGISVPNILFTNMKHQYEVLKKITTDPESRIYKYDIQTALKSKKKNQEQDVNFLFCQKKNKIKKNTDPFLVFPVEIIEMIFSHLSIDNLLMCRTVCKNWDFNLTNITDLFLYQMNFKQQVTISEFKCGVEFAKVIILKTYNQQIKNLKIRSVFNASHLNKILECLFFEKGLSIDSLELFDKNLSFQLFLNRLCKCSWRLNNLHKLRHLKLGLNSSLRFEDIIFKLFKNLRSLCIVINFPNYSSTYNSLLPTSDKFFKHLNNLNSNSEKIMHGMQKLTIINHSKLTQEINANSTINETYNPYPIYFDYSFPNIVELTIVSFNFKNDLQNFGRFFLQINHLKYLRLENNSHLSILDFCQILKNYKPIFELEKLIFRESKISVSQDLKFFSHDEINQLQFLKYLDIYGNLLSITGFLNFLTISCKSKNLKTLMIGNSKYLTFKTGLFNHRNTDNILSLYEILNIAKNLSNIHLNNLTLDDQSMKHFYNDIKNKIGIQNCNLKSLNLSFCYNIKGTGFIDLFHAYPPFVNQKNQDESSLFKLDILIIDGLEINPSTLNLLLKNDFVKLIINDPEKLDRNQYGINSLIIT